MDLARRIALTANSNSSQIAISFDDQTWGFCFTLQNLLCCLNDLRAEHDLPPWGDLHDFVTDKHAAGHCADLYALWPSTGCPICHDECEQRLADDRAASLHSDWDLL